MRRAGILLVATGAALVPLAVTARMGLWFAASIWILAALGCGVVTGTVARGVRRGGSVRRAGRWAPVVVVLVLVLAAVAVGIAGLAGAAVHIPAARSGAWAAWWVCGAGLVVAAALLWGWLRPWLALASACAAVALGVGAAALAVWLGAPAFGALAWIVGIVVWGNVVWLAPETGWGARQLDDRPREPR